MTLPQGTETILTVEDEDAIRKLTVRMLQPPGYRILEARDGEEAPNMCSAADQKIDLVLCDMLMPKKSGKEFARALFRQAKHPRVPFVSGYASGDTLEGKIIGRDIPYIAKHYTREQPAQKIRDVLDKD